MESNSCHSSAQDEMLYYEEEDDRMDPLNRSMSQEDQLETKSRGRPAIQEQWTKVISLSHDNHTAPKLQAIATSLMMVSYLPKVVGKSA